MGHRFLVVAGRFSSRSNEKCPAMASAARRRGTVGCMARKKHCAQRPAKGTADAIGAMARGAVAAIVEARGAVATVAEARGAEAVGALAVGAAAFGAVAVGGFAIGRLTIKRLKIDEATLGRVEIEELVVDDLEIGKLTIRERLPGGAPSETTQP